MYQVKCARYINDKAPTPPNPAESEENENENEADYVFDVKVSSDGRHLLASSSDRAVHLYDVERFSLVNRVEVHKDRISNVSLSQSCPSCFFTSSDDQTVKHWDARESSFAQQRPVFTLRFEEEVQAFAVSHNDSLLAVGVGCDIVFADVRKASSSASSATSLAALKACELGAYADVHSDIVTQLEFSPSHHNVLVSSAEDGLVCAFDTATEEGEEAVISILNLDCPVRKFGFFGPHFEGIYTLSTVETAALWHYPSAQRLVNFPNLREQLNTDYIVDCFYDSNRAQMRMLVGNYSGESSLVDVHPSGFGQTVSTLRQHSSTVRCCASLFAGGNTIGLVTGGEDGQLVLWQNSVDSPSTEEKDTEERADDMVVEDEDEHEHEYRKEDESIENCESEEEIHDIVKPSSSQPRIRLKPRTSKKLRLGLRHKPY